MLGPVSQSPAMGWGAGMIQGMENPYAGQMLPVGNWGPGGPAGGPGFASLFAKMLPGLGGIAPKSEEAPAPPQTPQFAPFMIPPHRPIPLRSTIPLQLLERPAIR